MIKCIPFAILVRLFFQTNANAELTTSLQKEQHLNTELASKLSEIGVELEEKKAEVGNGILLLMHDRSQPRKCILLRTKPRKWLSKLV